MALKTHHTSHDPACLAGMGEPVDTWWALTWELDTPGTWEAPPLPGSCLLVHTDLGHRAGLLGAGTLSYCVPPLHSLLIKVGLTPGQIRGLISGCHRPLNGQPTPRRLVTGISTSIFHTGSLEVSYFRPCVLAAVQHLFHAHYTGYQSPALDASNLFDFSIWTGRHPVGSARSIRTWVGFRFSGWFCGTHASLALPQLTLCMRGMPSYK